MSNVKPKGVHFYMTEKEKQLLKDYAEKTKLSQAEILRQFINTLDASKKTC